MWKSEHKKDEEEKKMKRKKKRVNPKKFSVSQRGKYTENGNSVKICSSPMEEMNWSKLEIY